MTVNRRIVQLIVVMLIGNIEADPTCQGRFVNPVSDICWSCLLPITVGKQQIAKPKGSGPRKRDTKNPKSPLCSCPRKAQYLGITIGFWEPVRLVDITRTPYCMVNLGGIEIGSDKMRKSGAGQHSSESSVHHSYYHTHYYIYPLIYWLELLTDFACLEEANFDVGYVSELDPTYSDNKLQSLANPEAVLFGNPIAQAACALDCAKATKQLASDKMFWCAGCYGNMYPLGGTNIDHTGGVKTGSLLITRILSRMHRTGLAEDTSTDDCSVDGDLCKKRLGLRLKKSQYKLQMLYPKSTSGNIGCWPLGFSDVFYSSGKEYPYKGEDWGYLIWRKRNCCLL